MLSGEILSKNRVVARVRSNRREVVDSDRCPLYLLKYDDAEGWLAHRAIDADRANARLLCEALHLPPGDDLAAVLRVHGATITDSYWFRADGEDLTYEQVKFRKENPFSRLTLCGDPDALPSGTAETVTPDAS